MTARPETITGEIELTGRYGVKLVDQERWTTVGRQNHETTGPIFTGYTKGQTITITMRGKRAVAVTTLTGGKKSAPSKPTTIKETVQRETKSAPKKSAPSKRTTTRASNGVCPVCGGNKHNNYGADEVTRRCLEQQFTNETGIVLHETSPRADALAFLDWKYAAPRVVFAKNATGKRILNGDTAPTDAPLETPAPSKPASKSRRAALRAKLAS